MLSLVLARLVQAVPLLVLVTLISLGLSVMAPVDPARMALAAGATGVQLDERDVAAKRVELGLDRPVYERYLRWWAGALRFDFGRSFANNRPVADVRGLDFVLTARAKGVTERVVLRRHVLPNALPVVLTVIGLDLTALFANAAVVEWVFAWPGLGRLGADAALASDVPVLQGFVLVVGWLVVLVNLAADVAVRLVDPRLRPA